MHSIPISLVLSALFEIEAERALHSQCVSSSLDQPCAADRLQRGECRKHSLHLIFVLEGDNRGLAGQTDRGRRIVALHTLEGVLDLERELALQGGAAISESAMVLLLTDAQRVVYLALLLGLARLNVLDCRYRFRRRVIEL